MLNWPSGPWKAGMLAIWPSTRRLLTSIPCASANWVKASPSIMRLSAPSSPPPWTKVVMSSDGCCWR